MPSNLKPTSAAAKQSILHFISSMVNVPVYKAISTLLSPCCRITATATAECTDKVGVYILTVKLSSPITFGASSFAFIIGSGTPVISPDGADTFVFADFIGSAGATTFNFQAASLDLLPTLFGILITDIPVTLPTCS